MYRLWRSAERATMHWPCRHEHTISPSSGFFLPYRFRFHCHTHPHEPRPTNETAHQHQQGSIKAPTMASHPTWPRHAACDILDIRESRFSQMVFNITGAAGCASVSRDSLGVPDCARPYRDMIHRSSEIGNTNGKPPRRNMYTRRLLLTVKSIRPSGAMAAGIASEPGAPAARNVQGPT